MKHIALCLLLFLSCMTFAQEEATEAKDDFIKDPTDLSTYLERFEEGLPKVADVQAVKQQATAAFDAGNCDTAIPLLETMAKQSNILANTLRQTLEPFYGGSYDDRENFSINSIDELIQNETDSNTFVSDRNSAWVMLGECEMKAGNEERAVGYFSEALDYISLQTSELDIWKRAALGIMEL